MIPGSTQNDVSLYFARTARMRSSSGRRPERDLGDDVGELGDAGAGAGSPVLPVPTPGTATGIGAVSRACRRPGLAFRRGFLRVFSASMSPPICIRGDLLACRRQDRGRPRSVRCVRRWPSISRDHGLGVEVAAEVFAELVLGVGVEAGAELQVELASPAQAHVRDAPQVVPAVVAQGVDQSARRGRAARRGGRVRRRCRALCRMS